MTLIKNTPVLRHLTAILTTSSKPLLVKELLVLLKKRGVTPNKTTIYRKLEEMEKSGMVQSIHIEGEGGGISYEKANGHHHHLVCEGCGDIQDVVMKNEDKLFTTFLREQYNFIPRTHRLEFFGRCNTCQTV